MFGRKKAEAPQVNFDSGKQVAAVRCSICTGEQVAGFKDIESGKFTEVMLIKDKSDLDRFMEKYGVSEIVKIY